MKVVAAGHFKYNGRAVRPREEVDMTPAEYADFVHMGLVYRRPEPADDEPPRGIYRRRDMRADG